VCRRSGDRLGTGNSGEGFFIGGVGRIAEGRIQKAGRQNSDAPPLSLLMLAPDLPAASLKVVEVVEKVVKETGVVGITVEVEVVPTDREWPPLRAGAQRARVELPCVADRLLLGRGGRVGLFWQSRLSAQAAAGKRPYKEYGTMKSKSLRALLMIALLGLAGCTIPTPAPSVQPPPGESAQSEKKRIVSPSVNEANLVDLVNGNSAFAFDLYQAIREGDGNLFYSPYSISLALAMTYVGARGGTEQQMADTLHYALPQDRLHPAFNGLDLELARRGEVAEGKDEKGFRLNIVNAIWGQEGYEFLSQFLDVLAQSYGAGLRLLDFKNAPEESRVTINQWVSEQTEGRIEDLIPPRVITRLTRLVLTNAIYFNAAWLHPFEESRTHDGSFHLLDGGEVTVPMMEQTESFGYAEGEGYQAVELPYDGRELSMVILLPEMAEFESTEGTVDAEQVNAILGDLVYTQVALTMPRFTFDSSFRLKKTLIDMGMSDAFSDAANFSGMTGDRDLFIADVIHKAFVSVDEEGTEAAAATAVVLAESAMPQEPVEMTVDRPFVFLIRDIETGTILFLGRVLDPSA